MLIKNIAFFISLLFLSSVFAKEPELKDQTDSLFNVFLNGNEQEVEGLFSFINSFSRYNVFYRKEKLLEQILKTATNNNKYNKYAVDAKDALGAMYILKGNNSLAFKYLSEVELEYKETKSYEKLFYSRYYLGSILYKVRDNVNASKYLKSVEEYIPFVDISKKSNDIINFYNILGLIERRAKRYDTAILYMSKALQIAEKVDNRFWVGLMNGNLASVYFMQKDYDTALPLLEKDMFLSLEHNEYGSAINAASLILQIYISKEEKKQSADSIAQKIIYWLDEKVTDYDQKMLIEPYKSLCDFFEKKGDFQQALKYKKLQLINQQTFDENQKIEEVARLQTTLDYEKQEQFINQQENSIRNQQFYFYIIAAVFGGMLVFLVFGIFSYAKQKKMLKTIRNQNITLKEQYELLNTQRTLIESQNRKMAELIELKDKIFSIVSHDLRNPIGNLKLIFELFENQDISLDEMQEMIQTMRPQVLSLYETLNNVLVWANMQIKSGLNANPKDILLLPMATEAKNLYQNICEKKQIEIQLQIPADTKLWIDENHLSIILRNLLSNAIKFTSTGGLVRVQFAENEQNIELSVCDSGVGMSKEELAQLFNKHFTKRGTDNERGTGLGLLLVRDFVEANGGKISVSSEKNKGTRFIITFSK